MEPYLKKKRLKTSFRPKPRVQILLFKFYKINHRQKARIKTANSRLYEIKNETSLEWLLYHI